jgi:DNA-binding transcriptional LysR family regulator
MNIHHLELFYYVARHRGISEAVRNIPYGIQQPAVSAQVIQLEEHLGVALFQRRPFALTAAGEELYAFIEPFFSSLDQVSDKIRGGVTHLVRIGASEVVQRDHLPGIVANVRRKYPHLKLLLREGYRPQLEAWLQEGTLDVAITVIEGKPPAVIHTEELIRLSLALCVRKDSPIKTGEDLWKRDTVDVPLIALPAAEAVCRHFQACLAKRRIDWFTSLEVSSLGLVETYVLNGFGVGLGLYIPKTTHTSGLRLVPLSEFPPVVVGAMWTGKRTPVLDAVIEECHRRAEYIES